jgi:exodeoxyribonuclease V beta subunit
MSGLRDPLQLPLQGIRVVEASAGTGKTFTIATLYLRLILEHGLLPDQIVVATFTRAATAELSERLRARLVRADDLLARDDPAAPEAGEDGETAGLRATIRQALSLGRSLDELRSHARKARLAMDSAMIGTLHGFCFRALGDFGFETGQALDEPELIEDLRALELEIVRDFWRRGSADASIARLLADTWGSPDALAKQLCDARWRGRGIEVPAVDPGVLESALAPIRKRIADWEDAVLDGCDQEIGASLDNQAARKARCRALRVLRAWARGELAEADPDGCALAEATRFERAEMEGLGSFLKHPDGQAFDAVRALHPRLAALVAGRNAMSGFRAAELLREARKHLEYERPRRLAARNLMGHDQAVDRLAAALAEPSLGEAAIAKMRARWKAALIDEFQDTDAAQWQVVRRLFGDTTLVLVGDPKQSIYGFRGGDVYAWREAVAISEHVRLELATSYRSGSGMTGAVNAMFDRPGAFIEDGFDYTEVAPDASVAARALLREGKILPALQLWQFMPADVGQTDGKPASKERARAGIEDACVAWLAKVLDDPTVELQERDGKRSRLRPKHIAVLVNSNAEAHSMQAALGRAGVAASSNLRASVHASDEAADLGLLLDALAAPDDIRRARAAHASVLIGHDAAALAAANLDPHAQAAMLEHVAEWMSALDRYGPLPWLHAQIAGAAPRILSRPDGERRVSNYLQLAELLQDLHATSFGIEDLASRFARARVEASDDPDSARLRIDTDADAVSIATVHAAKGLEYDVVLVPYAVLAFDPGKHAGKVPLYWHHVGNEGRVAIGVGTDPLITARALLETRAEEIRKFYVAVTRAKALCVLPWGETTCTRYSAAFHLLHEAGRGEPLAADSAGCEAALRELCGRAGAAAEVVPLPGRAKPRRSDRHNEMPHVLAAREFSRNTLQRDWRTWSFSRLVRGQTSAGDNDPAPGTGDGDAVAAGAPPARSTLAGPRFGTAVHAALEHADYAAWSGANETPESQRDLIIRCLRAQGLPESGMRIEEAVHQTGACVAAALNAALPCGMRVGALATNARRAELEFHLALAPAAAAQWFALLHRHGYQRQRHGVGVDMLHGHLTGVIDLVFEYEGRFHIIDWKTNWCPPYDDAALAAEIATHDYDLQWLIYTLALHRWLRQRIADYDYDRHVGEVYYLFVRGLGDGHGIHMDRPPRALIEAMDALFDAPAEAIA